MDDYARLHAIRIDRQLTGDEATIPDELKQALYRIVCEACGNAVRHGQCQAIEIRLSIFDENTVLEIQDNGIGINLPMYESHQEKGIGLFNMKRLVNNFAGTFSIDGVPGIGTKYKSKFQLQKYRRK